MLDFHTNLTQLYLVSSKFVHAKQLLNHFTDHQLLICIQLLNLTQKDYFTHNQIAYFFSPSLQSNFQPLFQNYLKTILPPNCRFQTLVSHIRFSAIELKNMQKWSLQINPDEHHIRALIGQFLMNQCLFIELKSKALANIYKYIFSQNDSKVTRQAFMEYCHQQALEINPQLLFDALASPNDEIYYPETAKMQLKCTNKQHLKQNLAKENLKSLLDRLQNRAKMFGEEWIMSEEMEGINI